MSGLLPPPPSRYGPFDDPTDLLPGVMVQYLITCSLEIVGGDTMIAADGLVEEHGRHGHYRWVVKGRYTYAGTGEIHEEGERPTFIEAYHEMYDVAMSLVKFYGDMFVDR